MKVKCIDANDTYPSLTLSTKLQVGEIYEVDKVYESGRYLLVEPPYSYNPELFEVVSDSVAAPAVSSPVATAPPIDVEEERCRRALMPYIAPGNCKCNVPKKDCPYHWDKV